MCHFTPHRYICGVDFPIPMTINSSSFHFVTVNHAQDLMCLKFKAFLMNKQHPSQGALCQYDPTPGFYRTLTVLNNITEEFQKSKKGVSEVFFGGEL